jgi:hypothetical protein
MALTSDAVSSVNYQKEGKKEDSKRKETKEKKREKRGWSIATTKTKVTGKGGLTGRCPYS